MRSRLGETRSSVRRSHALICEDSHEVIALPHWPGAEIVSFATPALGAGFSFFMARATEPTTIPPAPHDGLRFVLLRSGTATIRADGRARSLEAEAFACLPPGSDAEIALEQGARLLCLERPYRPLDGHAAPVPLFGSIPQITAQPIKGDPTLRVQQLLPGDPGYDMEINVMTFEPGASLPYVETHFMEHGLMMLDGGGIYRLDDRWYPVEAGDAIWMSPFCPQWFGALGRDNARYLIFKNWNRDPLV